MTNTMADLRREVAKRLRETLHGQTFDKQEDNSWPDLENMLGIVPFGAISTSMAERGTLLDPKHEFWQDYYEEISTRNAVKKEVIRAIELLEDDGILRVEEPHGPDGLVRYVEVEPVTDDDGLETECLKCGVTISADLGLSHAYGIYKLDVSIDCPECDFSKTLGRELTKHD